MKINTTPSIDPHDIEIDDKFPGSVSVSRAVAERIWWSTVGEPDDSEQVWDFIIGCLQAELNQMEKVKNYAFVPEQDQVFLSYFAQKAVDRIITSVPTASDVDPMVWLQETLPDRVSKDLDAKVLFMSLRDALREFPMMPDLDTVEEVQMTLLSEKGADMHTLPSRELAQIRGKMVAYDTVRELALFVQERNGE